jgi:hypothetical protein
MADRKGKRLTRREVLNRGTAFGTALLVGSGFIAHPRESWAAEVTVLTPETMATLVVMARDIYPHDRLADRYYAVAVKAHDTAEQKEMIEAGVAALDTLAAGQGASGYAAIPWEADRVALLRQVEATPFFQAVRGNLVVGLYNNQEVWPLFGYEGESFSKGGYIERGFNDIDWL